jgi:regulator of RNase E activity RraA
MNSIPDEITLEMMRRELYVAVVCDALDACGFHHQSPRVPLPAVTGIDCIVGRCATTLWVDMAHEDPKPYELELIAVDGCKPDDVMIAAAGGSVRSGIWGELLSTAARNSGCVGAIVHGAVRDVAKMTEMRFPIFASAVCPYDSMHRQRVVDVNVPVEIDGVSFRPGELVFADTDGVVVVPRDAERDVLRRAWQKVHDENRTRDAIRSGMKAVKAYDTYGVL